MELNMITPSLERQQWLERAVEAMADVVVNQRLFGVLDRALDRLELLGHLRARLAALDHLDDLLQVPVGTLETLDDVGMALMEMRLAHGSYPILPDRI